MNRHKVKLIDSLGKELAVAEVAEEENRFEGVIDLGKTPVSVRALFEEFEEIVNGQMFSFLDEIEEKIASLSIKAVFEDGCELFVKDLQIYPSSGDVSFRVAEIPAASTRPA